VTIGQNSLRTLSLRGVRALIMEEMDMATPESWVDGISFESTTNQLDGESYKWLSQVPKFREWIGSRQASGFDTKGFDVPNKKWDNGIEFLKDWLTYEKNGQLMQRIKEFGQTDVELLEDLVIDQLLAATTTLCYDGQFLVDTDHQEENSPVQSNKIDLDISAAPVSSHGSVANPTVQEMAWAIRQTVTKMWGFVSGKNRKLNRRAKKFTLFCSLNYQAQVFDALKLAFLGGGETNALANERFKVDVETGPEFSGWTDKFTMCRTDGPSKPFMRQKLGGLEWTEWDESSDYYKDTGMLKIGLDRHLNVVPASWAQICQTTLI